MAVADGTRRIVGRLYDMTGVSGYDPADGTDLGAVSDLVFAKIERDVKTYSRMQQGSTPVEASIDGSGIKLTFGLSSYSADVLKVISQNMRPTWGDRNFHGPLASAYPLGRWLSSTYILSLIVADLNTNADHPVVYIPRAVIVDVENLAFSPVERILDPATITVIGLYDSTIGDCYAIGDRALIDEPEAE